MLLTVVGEGGRRTELILREAEALEANSVGEASLEVLLHAIHVNAIVGALRARKRWLHSGEVKLHQGTGVVRVGLGAVIGAIKTLSLQVSGDHLDTVRVGADQVEVLNSLVINWEVAHSGTILGRHVCNSGSVDEREASATGSEELNELADDAALAKHVRASKHQVSGGGMGRKLTRELEADNLGQDHRNLLTQHH